MTLDYWICGCGASWAHGVPCSYCTCAPCAEKDADLAALREEVERLRENNRKLNERATKAEGAVKITVDDCRRQGVSLGRALANAGYAALEAENARLRAALQPFAEFGAVVGGNARDHVCGMYVAVGKRRDLHVSDFRAAARALAEGQT